jgi:phenylacetate-coenzyme A ligase PaaK-like adenylate-forming protein
VTNDASAAGGSSIAASSGSDGAQTVGASATTVTPPAAALNLAMQVGDCLLSAGMSANDVVVAMLGITDAYGLTRVHVDVTYTSSRRPAIPRGGRRRSPASEWCSRMTLITARYVRWAS